MSQGENRGRRGCCGCSFGCCGGAFMLVATIVVLCGAMFVIAQRNMPQPPAPAFTPDAVAANQFESAIQQAQDSASRQGSFSITVNEDQASSWLNLQAQSVADGEIPLENMQVRFQNGISTLYGEVNAFDVTNVSMEFSVALMVAPDGSLEVEVTESNIFGVSVPGSVREDVSEQMQEAIDNELRRVNQRYQLNAITANNGTLTVTGRVIN